MNEKLTAPVNEWSIVPEHTKEGHFYRVDEQLLPSVTTIIKVLDKSGPLMGWAVKMTVQKATELLARRADMNGNVSAPLAKVMEDLDDAKRNYRSAQQEAADVGSQGHKLVEKILLGEPLDKTIYDERLVNGLNAFETWYSGAKVVPVRVEAHLASKKHKYAGMADLIAMVDGKLCVIDFKFSTGIYDEYCYQLAAYVACVEEMTGKKCHGAYITRFDKKTGEFNPNKDLRFIPRKECIEWFKAFKHLVGYYYAKPGERK